MHAYIPIYVWRPSTEMCSLSSFYTRHALPNVLIVFRQTSCAFFNEPVGEGAKFIKLNKENIEQGPLGPKEEKKGTFNLLEVFPNKMACTCKKIPSYIYLVP